MSKQRDPQTKNAESLPHISNQCGRHHTAHTDVLACSLIESDHWWNFAPNFPLLKQDAPKISKSASICKTLVDLPSSSCKAKITRASQDCKASLRSKKRQWKGSNATNACVRMNAGLHSQLAAREFVSVDAEESDDIPHNLWTQNNVCGRPNGVPRHLLQWYDPNRLRRSVGLSSPDLPIINGNLTGLRYPDEILIYQILPYAPCSSC